MDITVKGLSKSFGSKRVFNDFNAVFPSRELTCIMGPSGAGKTTLMNIMMGLVKSDGGTVVGVPKRMSAVFQEDRLCEDFGSIANIHMVLGRRADRQTIKKHLESIGLGEEAGRVGNFSGGMKRRVAIVRALMAPSDILFLDEPFRGLDEETKTLAINYFRRNLRKRTAIMVTHSIREVRELGGNLVIIDRK
ncbi:MAG: ABC transporter ATP-binding protein [Clostridiales bacterium]|jgi:NitT/TauT family transport system ATP-binding protein|nr:ABC transporter ATP-binding protein [Clostridiales bacterium]